MSLVERKGATLIAHAPAKINLALHVTGQRADGYHTLETLAVFTRFGDTLALTPSTEDSFAITGAHGSALEANDANLVTRARDRLRLAFGDHPCPPVAITLEKNMPVSSGIGGGSSDGAATLRGLAALWGIGLDTGELARLAAPLGADLPMCVHACPLIARGIGEAIFPVSSLPHLHVVLANPGVAVSTPAVFAAMTRRDNAPLPALPEIADAQALAAWLAQTRNDLEAPAAGIAPEIGQTLKALQETKPLLARMSGSGATCFGLYDAAQSAQDAARVLASAEPGWFVVATSTWHTHS